MHSTANGTMRFVRVTHCKCYLLATPNVPIGVAFVNATGVPRWLGDDATLRVHAPSLRGCWPQVHIVDDRDQ